MAHIAAAPCPVFITTPSAACEKLIIQENTDSSNHELDGFYSSLKWVQAKFIQSKTQHQNINKVFKQLFFITSIIVSVGNVVKAKCALQKIDVLWNYFGKEIVYKTNRQDLCNQLSIHSQSNFGLPLLEYIFGFPEK